MKKINGFSLMELMISVVIVSIFSYLGVTSYKAYLERTNRVSAELTLVSAAQSLENYHHIHHTYAGATLPLPTASTSYQIALAKASEQNYLLEAIPTRQNQTCGTLRLDEKGNKAITGAGNVIKCWV